MKAPNRLERLIVEAAQDVSKRPALCTALLEEPLWFPVNYRADQPALAKPRPGDPVSFCLGQDDEGPFVPVYTSRSMLKDCLARFHQRHGLATSATASPPCQDLTCA